MVHPVILCQRCEKREATIKADAVVRVVYLCDECMPYVVLLLDECEPLALFRVRS